MNPDQTAPKGAVLSGPILFAIKASKMYKQISSAVGNCLYKQIKCQMVNSIHPPLWIQFTNV